MLVLGSLSSALALSRSGPVIGYSLTSDGQLFRFETFGPLAPTRIGAPLGAGITGLRFGPGGLYAFDNGMTPAQVFSINTSSGQRTDVSPPVAFGDFGTPLPYALDAQADTLLVADKSAPGGFRTVGPLGVDVGPDFGFNTNTNFVNQVTALATVRIEGGSTHTLHSVDLQTGALSATLATFPVDLTPVGGLALAEFLPPFRYRDFGAPIVKPRLRAESQTVGPRRKTFRLRGKAFDSGGVTRVFVKERGKPPRIAKGTSRWSYVLRLRRVRNVVRISAIDAAGNRSSPLTRAIIRRR